MPFVSDDNLGSDKSAVLYFPAVVAGPRSTDTVVWGGPALGLRAGGSRVSFLRETVCSVCLLLGCERSHTVSQFEQRQEQLHLLFLFSLLYERRLQGGVDSNDCRLKNFSR